VLEHAESVNALTMQRERTQRVNATVSKLMDQLSKKEGVKKSFMKQV